MKKAIMLTAAAIAMISAPLFADMMFSGELDTSGMTNADATKAALQKFELDLSAEIDEYNTLSAEIEDGDDLATLKAQDTNNYGTLQLNWAKVTTDWAGVFGLPMGLETAVGYDSFYVGDTTGLGVAGLEGIGGIYADSSVGMQINMSLLDGMIAPSFSYSFDTDNAIDYVAGLGINVAPVAAVLYMSGDYADTDTVMFGAEVVASLDMGLSLDGTFIYDTSDDTYDLGAGVAYTMDTLTVATSFSGTDENIVEYLAADAEYGLTDVFTLGVVSVFYLGDASGVDTFQGVDGYVSVNPSANANFKVGYVFSDGYGDVVSMNADGIVDGGVYLTTSFTF